MSDQAVINLYINDLANTTHEWYKTKADLDEAVAENANLKSQNASLSGQNSTLQQELATLQSKYDALKSGDGEAPVVEGQIVDPAPQVPAAPHF